MQVPATKEECEYLLMLSVFQITRKIGPEPDIHVQEVKFRAFSWSAYLSPDRPALTVWSYGD